MKLKKIFVTLGVSLAVGFGVAAGVTLKNASPSIEAGAALPVSSSKMYFNVSGFGPKYGDNDEYYTSFSVRAAKKNWADETWLEVTYEDRDNGIISVPDNSDYVWFIVVRSDKDTTNTWPNGTTSWNQTSNIERTDGQNYGWIWGEGDNWGKECALSTVRQAYITVNDEDQIYFEYDFVGNQQYILTNVYLEYGDLVTITVGENAYGYSALQDGEGDESCTWMFNEGSDNKILIKSSSKYEFYFKLAWPYENKIWAQIDSQIEAGTWAKNFLDNTICTVDENESPIGDPTFTEGWSWDELATSYNHLTNGAKNYIYSAGETMTDETQKAYVIEAVQRYDYIILNHESETFYRFIDNSNDVLRNASNSFKFSPIVNTIDNNVSIIVAVFVGLVAIGATALFIAKRKEQ